METLKLKTFVLHPLLSDEQIDIYNASNSVIISQNLFHDITNRDAKGNVAIIGLYYKSNKIYVDIIDSHNEDPNIMYVPQWIYNHFNYQEEDLVNYMQVFPKAGNRVKIKPKGDFYAYLDDPVSSLRNGFEKYSCLIENTTILINIDSIPLEIEILETYINSEKNKKNQPIYIRGVELEVDIESQSESQSESQTEEIIPVETNVNFIEDDIDFSSMLPKSYTDAILTKNLFPGTGRTLKKN